MVKITNSSAENCTKTTEKNAENPNAMMRDQVVRKVFGVLFILSGMLPFLLLTTYAFPEIGLMQIVVSFRSLWQSGTGGSAIWDLISWVYTLSFFFGVALIALGVVLLAFKRNFLFSNKRIGIPITVALGVFYLFGFIANIVILERNSATFAFYFYTIVKAINIIGLVFLLVYEQKININKQKRGDL